MEKKATIYIEGLEFALTSIACPEQYEVYYENKQVAYVRLRNGRLTCELPDVNGRLIYYKEFRNDPMKGYFDTEKERVEYLTKIAKSINKSMKIEKSFCKKSGFLYNNEAVDCTVSRVIVNSKAKVMVVYFKDGDKRVIKCSEEDFFDLNIGMALALARHLYGSNNNFHKEVALRTRKSEI